MFNSIYTTGLTGFLGKSLKPHLLSSYDQIINFTRRNSIQVIRIDSEIEQNISDSFFDLNPGEIFLNLATLYNPNPANIKDLENLIESNIFFPARTLNNIADLKIINALSYTQLLDFKNQNIYSLTKEILKRFYEIQSSNIINVYLFDTFGSGDTRNKVTDVFIKRALLNKQIEIPENEIRINLSDSEAVCISLMDSFKLDPGNYSIYSSNTISLESLAMKIISLCNKNAQINKKNLGTDFFGLIQHFPKNIYREPKGYNFTDSLEKRIREIHHNINDNDS